VKYAMEIRKKYIFRVDKFKSSFLGGLGALA